MGNVSVNRMTNANVYVDGASQLGKIEEIELPKLVAMVAEHKALGMVGKVEFFTGFDKMTARIKWAAFYPDAMVKAANPFEVVEFQVRGSLETYGPGGRTQQVPVTVYMNAQYKDFPMGVFKQHDNAEVESQLNVLYCKLEIDGREIVEFDALANIYKVDGVDMLEQFRNNTGT